MNENDMNGKGLYEYRLKLYRDAHSWNKPERVLFNPYVYSWMFLDAGYTAAEAARDYSIIEKCMIRLAETYKIDAINIGSSGYRFGLPVFDAFGGSKNWPVNKDGHIAAVYEDILGPDDYDAMKENLSKAMYELALSKQYPLTKTLTPQEWASRAKELQTFRNARAKVDAIMRDQYGILVEKDFKFFSPFFNALFDWLRGMKGISIDLRRYPEKVAEICEAVDEKSIETFISALAATPDGPGTEPNANYYDIMITMLGHTVLSLKQMEKFFFSPLKKILDFCASKNKQVLMQIEGSFDRFGDFLNDYDKGLLNVVVEMDDPFEVRKKFPDLAITGGLKVDMLGHATPQECVAAAKKTIDELGTDGGLVLMADKMVSYAYDMTSENLKAVGEFVSGYKIN